MKKIKIFLAPHVELRVHVSDRMVEDYRECAAKAELIGEDEMDCEACSWWGLDIGHEGICQFLELKQLLEGQDE